MTLLRSFGKAVWPGFKVGPVSFVDVSVLVPFAGPFVGGPSAGFSDNGSPAFSLFVAPGPASATAPIFSASEGSSTVVGVPVVELIAPNLPLGLWN